MCGNTQGTRHSWKRTSRGFNVRAWILHGTGTRKQYLTWVLGFLFLFLLSVSGHRPGPLIYSILVGWVESKKERREQQQQQQRQREQQQQQQQQQQQLQQLQQLRQQQQQQQQYTVSQQVLCYATVLRRFAGDNPIYCGPQ